MKGLISLRYACFQRTRNCDMIFILWLYSWFLLVTINGGLTKRHNKCSRYLERRLYKVSEIPTNRKGESLFEHLIKVKRARGAKRHRRNSHPASLRDELIPIPSSLERVVKTYLNTSYYSFTKTEGGLVEFQCNSIATKKFFREFPRSARRWVLNNHALQIEGDRMLFQLGTLAIQSLKLQDQGVYLCRIDYEPRQSKTVGLFSLVIESKTIAIRVKESTPLRIQCNSAPIGYLFPTATRQWEKDGVVMKSDILASDSGNDVFSDTEKSYTGQWLCLVKDNETGRLWKTALYLVHVENPPSFGERCLTFIRSNPILVATLAFGILAFFFVILAGMAQQAAKEKGFDQLQFDKFKNHFMDSYGGKTENKYSDSYDSYSDYYDSDQ